MANGLIAASKNLDKADFGFNPGQEIVKQIGSVMGAFEKKQASDKAEAYDVLENLNSELVGFEYMNEHAQSFYETALDDISPKLAKAKRTKDAKEVRRLEGLANGLIADQNLIGELLKSHAEDTLNDNYSEGANTHMLDMLTTGKYRIKEIDGERRVVFGKSANNETSVFSDKEASYLGGKNGIPLSKLADYAIVNDPNVTVPYTDVLKDIQKDAKNGVAFDNSPNKNRLDAVLNKMIPTATGARGIRDNDNYTGGKAMIGNEGGPEDDQLVNLLYTRDFNLANGKNLAEMWVDEHFDKVGSGYKTKENMLKNLKPGDPSGLFNMVVTGDKGDFKAWVKEKLTTGASNYHKHYFKKKGSDNNITQAAASLFGTKSIPMPGFPGVYLDPQTRYNRRLSVLNENSNSPITLQSGTWSYNAETKKWNDGTDEQLTTYQLLDREALRIPSDRESKKVKDPLSVGSDMLLGKEKEIVERFSNNEKLKQAGFTFERERDIVNRAMNIYYGDKSIEINLDDSMAVEKIMKFFKDNKPNLE